MSLQDELAGAQAKVLANNTDIQSISRNRDDNEAEIRRIKAEIKAEKKPKLRHLDYGVSDRGYGGFVAVNGRWVNQYGNTGDEIDAEAKRHFVTLGNTLDDLKALSEDVTESSVKSRGTMTINIKTREDKYNNRVCIEQGGDYFFVPHETLGDFILKLRQMQATIKRKEV